MAVRTPPLPKSIVSCCLIEKHRQVSLVPWERPGRHTRETKVFRGMNAPDVAHATTQLHKEAPPGPPRTDPSHQPDTGAPCRWCVRAGMSVPARIAGSSHRWSERLELLTGRDRSILHSGAMARIGDRSIRSRRTSPALSIQPAGRAATARIVITEACLEGRPGFGHRAQRCRFARLSGDSRACLYHVRLSRYAQTMVYGGALEVIAGCFPAPQTDMLLSATDTPRRIPR